MTDATTAAVTDIPRAAATLLDEARDAKSGRGARTLIPGAGAPLKQTLLALTAGTVLADHENPGTATLYVLQGRVRLTSTEGPLDLDAGSLAPIPEMRHGVESIEDAVLLISVATRPDPA